MHNIPPQSVDPDIDFAHDGSTTAVLGILQAEYPIWPYMASETAFELCQKNEDSHIRVLFSGQPLGTSTPLDVLDMIKYKGFVSCMNQRNSYSVHDRGFHYDCILTIFIYHLLFFCSLLLSLELVSVDVLASRLLEDETVGSTRVKSLGVGDGFCVVSNATWTC